MSNAFLTIAPFVFYAVMFHYIMNRSHKKWAWLGARWYYARDGRPTKDKNEADLTFIPYLNDKAAKARVSLHPSSCPCCEGRA